jgi:hypothetical protein
VIAAKQVLGFDARLVLLRAADGAMREPTPDPRSASPANTRSATPNEKD